MNKHQIIALWGSPGSGATLTSIKLAREFAAKKMNVLVVLCDTVCPAIPTLLPDVNAKEKSLGRLLSQPSLSQESILQHLIPCKPLDHLALTGYIHGDTAFTYANYTKERALDFLTLTRHLADIVIVDCSTLLSADPLSVAALEVADQVFRIHECTLKSLVYFASHLPLLGDSRFRIDNHLHLLSNVKNGQDSVQYSNMFGGIHHLLPCTPALEQQFFAAQLFSALEGKEGQAYQNIIEKIAGRFMEVTPKKEKIQLMDSLPLWPLIKQKLKGGRS